MKWFAVRVGHAIWALWFAVTICFFLIRASGDPAVNVVGPNATAEALADMRHRLGTDRPLLVQYGSYLWDVVRGDLGESLRYGISNASLITDHAWATMRLALVALALVIPLGVGLGTLMAVYRGRVFDRVLSSVTMLTQAMPSFWVGLILILIFAVRLGWFPASGDQSGWTSVILPSVAAALFPLGQIARVTRSAMISALDAEFVTALRSRGVPTFSRYVTHALRNAALPIITMIGLMTGALLSASVTVEYVFSWPGLGLLTIQAIEFRDLSLVQSIVLVGAAVYIAINLVVDVLYMVLDPRTRRAHA